MSEELSFDWDRVNIAHLARHRVTPVEVEQFFANDPTDVDFDVIGGEERWTAIGTRMRFGFC